MAGGAGWPRSASRRGLAPPPAGRDNGTGKSGDGMHPTRRGLLAAAGGLSLGTSGLSLGTNRLAVAAALPAPEAAAITLGALFPLSGPRALAGDESLRGLELAVAAQNRLGGVRGKSLVLVSADAADPAMAAAAAHRLIGQARAAVLFGTTADPLSLAATAVAELAATPYFELCATGGSITGRGFLSLFRTCPTAEAIAALSVDAIGALVAPAFHVPPAVLRPAILHLDAPAPARMAALQLARCQAEGLPLSGVMAYSAAAADLAILLRRLREARAEVVLHSGFVNDTLILFHAMAREGWRPRAVIGTGDAYAMADTAQVIGAAFTGAFAADFTPYDVSPAAAPEAAAVARLYRRAFGMAPRSGLSLATFTGARMAFAAMARAASLAPAPLRAAVLATAFPPHSLAAGWGAAFDRKGQNRLAQPVLGQWRPGRLVAVFPPAMAAGRARFA